MKAKQLRRAATTIIFNAGLYYLAYLALILSVEGAGNVLCVFAAIHFLAGFLALCMKEVHKGAYLRGPSIPARHNLPARALHHQPR